jgi:hypothetical protein
MDLMADMGSQGGFTYRNERKMREIGGVQGEK